MEKSSRQKWAPPVIETVLLLRAADKGGGKKATRFCLGIYLHELLIPVQTRKERVFLLLQYGSGGCSSA